VFSRGKTGVQEQAFGQEVSATFALHNFEFVLHGFILEFGFWLNKPGADWLGLFDC
jgi:hypothetical protein